MEYITSVQRIGMEMGMEVGMEKGMEKGMHKGIREGAFLVLVRLLGHRFGSLPDEVTQRLHLLSVEEVEGLVDVALTVRSLDEFAAHLPVSPLSTTELAATTSGD